MKTIHKASMRREGRQQRRRRFLQIIGMMMASSSLHLNFADASQFRPNGNGQRDYHTPAMVGGQGQDHFLMGDSSDGSLSKRGRRRRIMSKITSVRGGSTTPSSNKVGDNINSVGDSEGLTHFWSKVPVESITGPTNPSSSTPILSTLVFILSQSINVASAAIVVSGYFGSWTASWMVSRMHKLLPALTKSASSAINNGIDGSGAAESSNNWLLQDKYRLTTLATIGFVLLHATGIQSNNLPSRISDATFLALLWTHSHIVNPILGGMIGCTHIALNILSMILGSPKLVYSLDDLGEFRMKELGQFSPGEEDPYVIAEKRVARVPVVTSGPRSAIKSRISSMCGSASLLLVFPQYFLGMYLLGSTLVSWWSSKQSSDNIGGGGWKRFGKWMAWLSGGICASYDESGNLKCSSIDTAATAIGNAVEDGGSSFNSWKVSKRLVALYWIIALAKATVAFIVL